MSSAGRDVLFNMSPMVVHGILSGQRGVPSTGVSSMPEYSVRLYMLACLGRKDYNMRQKRKIFLPGTTKGVERPGAIRAICERGSPDVEHVSRQGGLGGFRQRAEGRIEHVWHREVGTQGIVIQGMNPTGLIT